MSQLNVSRVDWVDYAKGICIILVVLMHTTLGIEKIIGSQTWLHSFITWAQPFRMPDFFLISGLFLGSRIARPWREYFDTKVLHFAYFYILWMTIQFSVKSAVFLQAGDFISIAKLYALGLVEPYGTLWFIYLLAVFFVVTKISTKVPALIIFLLSALLQMASIETGWLLIDEFAARFVYFYAGFWLAKHVFAFSSFIAAQKKSTLFSGLIVWAFVNHVSVQFGLSQLPLLGLILGFIGTGAVITFAVVLAQTNFTGLIRYCGANSIVIYLSFSLFMGSTRTLLLNEAEQFDYGVLAIIVTIVATLGPLVLVWITRGTALDFLFHRPNWARLAKEKKQWHTAPHVPNLFHKTR